MSEGWLLAFLNVKLFNILIAIVELIELEIYLL